MAVAFIKAKCGGNGGAANNVSRGFQLPTRARAILAECNGGFTFWFFVNFIAAIITIIGNARSFTQGFLFVLIQQHRH
jgi:hypothetical protein